MGETPSSTTLTARDFGYELPPSLIAQRPTPDRRGSRLMVLGRAGPPAIGPFAELPERLHGDEVLVLNDTRVVPARVRGRKSSGGAVEVLVLEPPSTAACSTDRSETLVRIRALVRGARLRPGAELHLPGGVTATLETRHPDGTASLALRGVPDLLGWLAEVGAVPLPPYIQRAPDAADAERYQTVVAKTPGAVAAPTAGLHFDEALLGALRAKGVAVHTLTLHVGLGTFLPLRARDLEEVELHEERFSVPPETARAVRSGRPVIAVGTTVVRALETFARDPHARRTRIFIRPGFEHRIVDGLLTNFHLPESSLLMLVCALGGRARVLAAYRAAVAARMRFYSYGDAMLVYPTETQQERRWRPA